MFSICVWCKGKVDQINLQLMSPNADTHTHTQSALMTGQVTSHPKF